MLFREERRPGRDEQLQTPNQPDAHKKAGPTVPDGACSLRQSIGQARIVAAEFSLTLMFEPELMQPW